MEDYIQASCAWASVILQLIAVNLFKIHKFVAASWTNPCQPCLTELSLTRHVPSRAQTRTTSASGCKTTRRPITRAVMSGSGLMGSPTDGTLCSCQMASSTTTHTPPILSRATRYTHSGPCQRSFSFSTPVFLFFSCFSFYRVLLLVRVFSRGEDEGRVSFSLSSFTSFSSFSFSCSYLSLLHLICVISSPDIFFWSVTIVSIVYQRYLSK